jgi:hypothetical protein
MENMKLTGKQIEGVNIRLLAMVNAETKYREYVNGIADSRTFTEPMVFDPKKMEFVPAPKPEAETAKAEPCA